MSDSGSDPSRITIVGGRPPEEGPSRPEVPGRMQDLLQMASEDPQLKAALLDDRVATLDGCGVLLTENERRILLSVPRAQLEQMMGHLRAPQPERRQFLRRAGGLLAAALVAGCVGPDFTSELLADSSTPSKSPTPERPRPTKGIRPDRPSPRPTESPTPPMPPQHNRGIRPDRPIPSTTPSPTESPNIYPHRNMPAPPGGCRPDRP